MKVQEVTVIDKNKEFTIVLVKHSTVSFFGRIKTTERKAFKKTNGYLWMWLDNNEIVEGKSNSIDAIISTGKENYKI